MTLTEALQYLETTSRVSCPQITCEQAREIAEVLRGHQSIIDLAVMLEDGVKHGAGCCDEIGRGRRLTQIREHIEHVLSGRQAEQVKNQLDDAWSERDESRLLADREFTLRQRAEKERDEALAKLREVEGERRAEIDCGQTDICAKPPGCQKHWAFKASELVRERNEIHARFYLFDCEDGCGCGDRHCWRPGRTDTRCVTCKLIDSLEETEEVRQAACGFAWDAGREMAALEWRVAYQLELLDDNEREFARKTLESIEAAPDFDADDYAKPGRR